MAFAIQEGAFIMIFLHMSARSSVKPSSYEYCRGSSIGLRLCFFMDRW